MEFGYHVGDMAGCSACHFCLRFTIPPVHLLYDPFQIRVSIYTKKNRAFRLFTKLGMKI